MQITPTVQGANADIRVETRVSGEGEVAISILDAEGREVLAGKGGDTTLTMEYPHLWDGIRDPYLYTCVVRLMKDGQPVDEVRQRFGVRSFSVDAKQGFFLNGRPYPLHGVSRHQDRKGLGNAITREMHDEDMQLIKELGANTIRLAHYQHDQYFYDLCDEVGMVVWAKIPYISEHMPNGRANTISQMKELDRSRTTTMPASSAGGSPTRSPSPPRITATCGTTTANSTISATRWIRPA